MKTKQINLFVVAENALVANGLRHFLEDRFGSGIRVTSFCDSKTMLKNINDSTSGVVIDYVVEGKKGGDILKAAKALNPRIQGVYHSTAEDVAAAVSGIVSGENAIQYIEKQFTFKMDDQYNHYYARL